MNNQELLAEIIDSGEVPERVTNRLLLSAVIQNSEKTDKAIALLKEQNGRITALEQRQAELIDNPSLVYLLRQKPRQTIVTLIIVFAIMFALWTVFTPVRDLILVLVGIPIP
jgi:hypothetical protein